MDEQPSQRQQPEPLPNDFENASQQPPPSLLQEFWLFLVEEKKWWLIPILVSLALIAGLAALAATGAAPFIYPLG